MKTKKHSQLVADLMRVGYTGSCDLSSLLEFFDGIKEVDNITQLSTTLVTYAADYHEVIISGADPFNAEEVVLSAGYELSGETREDAAAEAICWFLEHFEPTKPERERSPLSDKNSKPCKIISINKR